TSVATRLEMGEGGLQATLERLLPLLRGPAGGFRGTERLACRLELLPLPHLFLKPLDPQPGLRGLTGGIFQAVERFAGGRSLRLQCAGLRLRFGEFASRGFELPRGGFLFASERRALDFERHQLGELMQTCPAVLERRFQLRQACGVLTPLGPERQRRVTPLPRAGEQALALTCVLLEPLELRCGAKHRLGAGCELELLSPTGELGSARLQPLLFTVRFREGGCRDVKGARLIV